MAVNDADLLVLAVPILGIGSLLEELACLKVDWSCKVITDVGSCKQVVVDSARNAFGGLPENLVAWSSYRGFRAEWSSGGEIRICLRLTRLS